MTKKKALKHGSPKFSLLNIYNSEKHSSLSSLFINDKEIKFYDTEEIYFSF